MNNIYLVGFMGCGKSAIGRVLARMTYRRFMDTDALIEEFQDKQSGNVSLIRKEMRERYKANRDRQKIAIAFNNATKSDQQWVKWQIRKERYRDSGNNQWKKPL